jgi:hypothetical protein
MLENYYPSLKMGAYRINSILTSYKDRGKRQVKQEEERLAITAIAVGLSSDLL